MSRWRFFNVLALSFVAVMIATTMAYVGARDEERFSYTQDFTSAVTLENECLGMICDRSLQYAAAYRSAHDDPAIVFYLEQRFDRAPRAAQFYIAFIARAHDRDKGQALFKKLAAISGETIQGQSYDVINEIDVGKVARVFLSRSDMKMFR